MQSFQTVVRRFAKRPLRQTLLLLALPLLLSGCLRYDLTLRFDHQSHGQILQTIDLSDRGAALAQPTLEPWLEDLKVRSRPLGGQLSESPQTVTLTVPFGTAADLGDRFRQLFAAAVSSETESLPVELPPLSDSFTYLQLPGWEPVPFALDIQQTNWLLASRTHLTYRIDLGQLPTNGDNSAEPAPWADLRFRLQVPWGLQLLPTATPPTQQDATGATWPLEPGEITTIDAIFWLPNAIALGTLGIVTLVLAGYGLRYRIFRPKLPIL